MSLTIRARYLPHQVSYVFDTAIYPVLASHYLTNFMGGTGALVSATSKVTAEAGAGVLLRGGA